MKHIFFSFFLLIAAGAVYASSLEEKPAVIPRYWLNKATLIICLQLGMGFL